MRLLLRSNAHSALPGGGLELASSPDTAGREVWQWHLRLDTADAADAADTLGAPRAGQGGSSALERVATEHAELTRRDGGASTLSLSTDPRLVRGRLEALALSRSTTVTRQERQLVVLVVGGGEVLGEGRHRLNDLDVLVLEGDDPYEVTLEPLGHETVTIGVARLDLVDSTRLAWVP